VLCEIVNDKIRKYKQRRN